MLICALLDALQGPLWYSVQATGKIKTYQILMSFMILANLPIAYVCLKLGYSPSSVLAVRCIINLATLFVRLWYLNRLYKFPVMEFVHGVICRIAPITMVTYLITYIPVETTTPLIKIVVIVTMSIVANIILIPLIGLNKDERLVVGRNIKRLYEKYRRG